MKQTHKPHVFHLKRVGLFGVLLFAFFIVRLDAGQLPVPLQSAQVLSYASEMSRSALLSGTNAARSANGLGGFALNSQLNNSAQAKAQDMANKDYWAHTAPDGTQPWYFFDQAGYAYIRAGENLAYGFTTSQATIDGWMNSTSHRANILGNYNDVGFGIVNIANYQSSGEQTIVVAHYGAQQSASPPPAPAAPAATPATPSAPVSPTTTPTSTTAPDVVTPPAEQPVVEATPVATPAETTAAQPAAEVQTANNAQVSLFSMIAQRRAPLAALLSLLLVSTVIVGFALTHRAAFTHAVSAGEHFVVAHPGVDSGIVAALTSLILLTTYGHIG